MKRAILLLVVVVGGAFYLGWFTFTTDSSGPTEHVDIAIDKGKVEASEQQAIQGAKKFVQQLENHAATATSGQTATFTGPGSLHIGGDGAQQGTATPVGPGSFHVGGEGNSAPGFDFNNPTLQGAESGATTIGPDPYQATTPPAGRPAAQTASEPFSRGFE